MPERWSNWSGSVTSEPRRIVRPRTEEDLVSAMRGAAVDGLNVRVYGTGHSFMPLAATDGVLISLDDLQGIVSCDPSRMTATVWAGTKLTRVGELLLERGFAMEQLGDINVQSIAGAIGTGTHGTGPSLRNIPSQVVGLRIVTTGGEILECTTESDPDLMRAARVSMGTMGVFSTVTLRVLPAYQLHERIWQLGADDCLEQLDDLIAATRHFEFFWYPRTDRCECKRLQPTTEDPATPLPEGERVGWSANILPSVREMKFNEQEYSVPAEAGPDCFRAVRKRMLSHHPGVVWPVEYRTLAPDDAHISTAHERATVAISIHQDARLPFHEFFDDIEAIFVAHDGRPHWGKIHTRDAAYLRRQYPRWDDFCAARDRMDPAGRMLNPYLAGLFRPSA